MQDDTDKKLIEILRNNSREPFVELARKLGISEPAVRRRLKRMVDGGFIKLTVEVREKGATKAIVLVSTESTAETWDVSTKLTKVGGVCTVYEITGQYDIAVIMSAESITEINSGIDALRKTDGVTDTHTVIILRTVT